jgi:hypothetical protein
MTNEKTYVIAKKGELFWIIALMTKVTESPAIKERRVVTVLLTELKNETFGKKHMPKKM